MEELFHNREETVDSADSDFDKMVHAAQKAQAATVVTSAAVSEMSVTPSLPYKVGMRTTVHGRDVQVLAVSPDGFKEGTVFVADVSTGDAFRI